MKLFGSRGHPLPALAQDALKLARAEQAIVWALADDETAVIATTFRIVAISPDGTVRVDRPWHEVDSGHWDSDTWTLTASWVDHRRPAQWTFPERIEGRLPEAFRERVQATVMLSEPLALPGPGRSGRVVLRKDLSDQRVFVQEVLGRGTPKDDPEVRAEVARLRAYLEEQAGL